MGGRDVVAQRSVACLIGVCGAAESKRPAVGLRFPLAENQISQEPER